MLGGIVRSEGEHIAYLSAFDVDHPDTLTRPQRDSSAGSGWHHGPVGDAVRRLHTSHSTDAGHSAAMALRTWRRPNRWMFLHFLNRSALLAFPVAVRQSET